MEPVPAHWPVVGLALWWEMSSGGKCPLTGNVLWWVFFFHEYGRRVGMVPRSSLKEGKYNQMVEKRTKKTQQQNNRQPQPTGRVSTIL